MNFTEINNDTSKLMIPAFTSTFQFKQLKSGLQVKLPIYYNNILALYEGKRRAVFHTN